MSSSNTPSIAPSPGALAASAGGQTPSANLAPKPVTKIVTSKAWVLPPRPKPGRKPSADTPATKRKAQNRAAQRAFRERRATRVAELETKLTEVEKEKENKELNLKNMVTRLQQENKFLLNALNEIKADYANFKQSISQSSTPTPQQAIYSNGTVNAPSPLNYFKPTDYRQKSHPHQHQQQQHQQQQYPQQYQQQYAQQQHLRTQPISPALSNPKSPNDTFSHKGSVSNQGAHFDCGVCEKDDCLCAQVGLRPHPQQISNDQQGREAVSQLDTFRPMAAVSLKRPINDTEVDYTAKFAKVGKVGKPMPKFKKLNKSVTSTNISSSSTALDYDQAKEFSNVFDKMTDEDFQSPMEQCGFCSDDTPCVCREAAKEAANAITELQNHSRKESLQVQAIQQATLPPISRNSSVSQAAKLPVLHPGPTVEISEAHRSSISTPKDTTNTTSTDSPSGKQKSSGGGCTGNPGTCTQCQLDPMSTLFCTTIASKAEGDEEDEEAVPQISTTNSSAITSGSTASLTPTSQNNTQTSTSASPRVIKAESKKDENNSPVSPPLSNVSSKVSSPMTVTSQEEELNSLIKKSSEISTPNGSVSSQGSVKGIYIPCADAYKTLSRHKGFHSVDFSTLVGKLTTRGMQVEVQSVANVLRELDRRLYN